MRLAWKSKTTSQTAPALLTAIVCLLTLASCQTLTSIIATEPERPTEAQAVRLLCTRDEHGEFIFGPVALSRADTQETKDKVEARNDAWDAATKEGKLCGIDFGGVKWGGE